MTDTLIILGSSRRRGNTRRLVDHIFAGADRADIVDLSDHLIGPYDYEGRHDTDDFSALARRMGDARVIVFASPVYWYSMSGQMKIFFDRLTDLTDSLKPIGKGLRGKPAFAVSTSKRKDAPASFVAPFADTAGYFEMAWGGHFHAQFIEDGVIAPGPARAARSFAQKIERAMAVVPAGAQKTRRAGISHVTGCGDARGPV